MICVDRINVLTLCEQAVWPKATLHGVKSAMSSRKIVAASMNFQFQRFVGETIADNSYELSVMKPIGLEIEGRRGLEWIPFWK